MGKGFDRSNELGGGAKPLPENLEEYFVDLASRRDPNKIMRSHANVAKSVNVVDLVQV